MAVYDLEEQEQIAALRAWWQRYGAWVSTIAVVAALAGAGWYGWQRYQKAQDAEAGRLYLAMQVAMNNKDTERLKPLAAQLEKDYAGSQFSVLGAFLAANALDAAGDAKAAQKQLVFAVEHGKDALSGIARLRLAGMQLDQKDYDAALKTLSDTPPPGFAARFEAARGDNYAAQGKLNEARASYAAALKLLDLDDAEKAAAKDKAGELGSDGQFAASEPGQLLRRLVIEKRDALPAAPVTQTKE